MGQVSSSDSQNYLPLEPFMSSNNRRTLYEHQNCPVQDTFHFKRMLVNKLPEIQAELHRGRGLNFWFEDLSLGR